MPAMDPGVNDRRDDRPVAVEGEFRVAGVRRFGPYALVSLLAPAIAACATPGQFVMVSVPQDGFHLRRPLSVHSTDGERLRLLIEPRGAGTRALTGLDVADVVSLGGPLGTGFPLESVEEALLIGGGIGAAPLQFVHDALHAAGVTVTAAFGFRDTRQARLVSAFDIEHLYVATDDGSVGRTGTAVALAPMLHAVRSWAASRGLDGYVSLEAHMACGTGACHGCVLPTADGYRRVCVDGPVFALSVLEGL